MTASWNRVYLLEEDKKLGRWSKARSSTSAARSSTSAAARRKKDAALAVSVER